MTSNSIGHGIIQRRHRHVLLYRGYLRFVCSYSGAWPSLISTYSLVIVAYDEVGRRLHELSLLP